MDYIDAIKDKTNVIRHKETGKVYLVHCTEIDRLRRCIVFTVAGENNKEVTFFNDEVEYVSCN